MLNKKRDTYFYILLSLFVVAFILLGVWIQQLMLYRLRDDVQEQLSVQNSIRAQRIEEYFEAELNDMNRLVGYLNKVGLERFDLLNSYYHYDVSKEGVIDLYTNLEAGISIDFQQFPNIRESFRGRSAVSFSNESGLLFTVPILRDGNVQYVYYRHYNSVYVRNNFRLRGLDEQGYRIAIVDSEDNVVVPFSSHEKSDEEFFFSQEMSALKTLMREKMKYRNSAGLFFNSSRGPHYLFMTAIPDTDFYLIGYVNEEAVSGDVFQTVNIMIVLYIGVILMIASFLYFYNRDMLRKKAAIEERNRKVELLSDEIMTTLAMTIDAKDKYTNGHSQRVAIYSELLARHLGYDEEFCHRVKQMALLHDIGKIGVPDSVLNKEGKLTDEEFTIIKSHTAVGSDILKNVEAIPDLWQGARYHHERFDGRGYPDKLQGENIPEIARIIAVADSYDAMTSKRCYRDALPQKVVYEEIKKGRGSQFDAKVAEMMLKLMDEDKDYQLRQK